MGAIQHGIGSRSNVKMKCTFCGYKQNPIHPINARSIILLCMKMGNGSSQCIETTKREEEEWEREKELLLRVRVHENETHSTDQSWDSR